MSSRNCDTASLAEYPRTLNWATHRIAALRRVLNVVRRLRIAKLAIAAVGHLIRFARVDGWVAGLLAARPAETPNLIIQGSCHTHTNASKPARSLLAVMLPPWPASIHEEPLLVKQT